MPYARKQMSGEDTVKKDPGPGHLPPVGEEGGGEPWSPFQLDSPETGMYYCYCCLSAGLLLIFRHIVYNWLILKLVTLSLCLNLNSRHEESIFVTF